MFCQIRIEPSYKDVNHSQRKSRTYERRFAGLRPKQRFEGMQRTVRNRKRTKTRTGPRFQGDICSACPFAPGRFLLTMRLVLQNHYDPCDHLDPCRKLACPNGSSVFPACAASSATGLTPRISSISVALWEPSSPADRLYWPATGARAA